MTQSEVLLVVQGDTKVLKVVGLTLSYPLCPFRETLGEDTGVVALGQSD